MVFGFISEKKNERKERIKKIKIREGESEERRGHGKPEKEKRRRLAGGRS